MPLKDAPFSDKITLVQLDIGTQQTVWFNRAAGVWYVDFDAVYALIDAAFLAGVVAQSTGNIGSVSSDAAQLLSVPDLATCQATELSFYWNAAGRELYVHLQNGDEPSLHRLIIGVVYGVSNHAGVWGGTIYEPRLRSAPAITKSKDPLFFGRVSFDGGTIGIDNTDGFFDWAGEDNALFGNAVRIFQGFDDQDFAQFIPLANGVIENVRIGEAIMEVDMIDKRKGLSRKVPFRFFDTTTYPNLKPGSQGKVIPLAYGTLYNVPCVCTNEEAGGPPANYTFKICDCTDHAIKAITTVYVEGVTKATSATDLTLGTFSLSSANYTKGQLVTADIQGYKTAGGVLIENAADIILDLMNLHLGIADIPSAFNQAEWLVARASAMNVGMWTDKATEVYALIEDLCASSLLDFIQQDDGRFTLRAYTPNRAVSQTFAADELMEVPQIEYDTTQVLTDTDIEYARDQEADEPRHLIDTSQQAAIFALYKTYRGKPFETLLTNASDAQTYSNAILALSGAAQRLFTLPVKTQAIGREIGDFIICPIVRRGGAGFLGNVKAEIIRVSKDLLAAGIDLDCRIVELLPETALVEGPYYDDLYYLDDYYGVSDYQEVG